MCDAFATSTASNLVSKLGEYLFAPIGRQFGYVLSYKSYVEDLKKEVSDLKNARERVQYSVDKAVYDGKPIFADVKVWLENVKKEAEEAENLLRDGESAKNACFRGWLPNPLVRHSIGRKVKKMTQVIQELHKKSNFPEVHYDYPPIGIITAITSAAAYADNDEDVPESRASFAEKVIKAIADDKVCVVGVYGPGGVGKSKLLADIKRRAKKEKLFDVVVTADVSRSPNLRKIQGEIAYELGLKIMNEETARGRADLLCRRLESDSPKNILIILDNLWKKLELNEVGIPCGFDNKVRGCKLLLTSRNRDVLRIDMGSDQEFRLNELEQGEAQRLFERTVGDRVNDLDIKPWVDGVVKNCGGLPLLIVSSAKRLKHGELAAWRNASTHRDVSDVKSIAEQNYNDLGDERIRKLFLVCALNSSDIGMRFILPYCMGLGLYKQFSMTIESARDRLVMDLRSLQNSSLLLDGDDIEDLKMHDIFVDMAVSITSMEWKALIGRKDYGFKEWSKDELSKCTAISFPFVGIDELPEKLDCPNLKMFVLAEDNESLKFSESFFESMEKLQVLDLTCLSFTSLPTSIKFLENLNSLCLDYCHLEDVTVLGKLKGLQFLSFHGSIIARLPKEIGGLTELRFLDLIECFRLQIIEPGMLESLVNLEELYIDEFCQWEAEDEALRSNASLAELKNMKKLRTLHITIPHSTNLSSDLPFGNLNEYKIRIGAITHWCDEYKESRSLKLNLDPGNLLREACMQECLGRTQDLCLDGLQDDRDSIHDLCTKGFQELKHLCVKNNLSLQYVVGSTQSTGFMRLESLVLQNLNNLKKICRDCLTPESFSKLKIVKVENCEEIKYLFPSSMTRIFLQLEEIEINRCHLMQQIVGDDDVDEYGDEIDDDVSVKSCKLRRLTLQNLPEMMSFYKTVDHSVVALDGQQILFPSLEELTVVSCGLMKIWHNEISKESFCKLASITIRDCENLSHIFPSNKIEVFQSLKMIEVVNCTSLESLMEHVAVNTKKRPKSLVFLYLNEVKLRDLPRLDALVTSSSHATLSLPSLTTVSLRNCHSLRYLFTYDTSRTLDKLEMLDVSDCNKMQEVVAMEESEERKLKAVKFSRLCTLKLCSLKSLISFSSGSCAFEFPSLTNLSILECTELKTFILRLPAPGVETTNEGTAGSNDSPRSLFDEKVEFPKLESMKILLMDNMEKIWLDDLDSNAFGKLKTLEVENCEKLLSIFSSYNMLTRFQNLEKITVTDCASLEVVFQVQECEFSETCSTNTFQLRELVLMRLSKMKHVWSGLPQGGLTFGRLQCMDVVKCKCLKSLFPSLVAKSMTQLEKLNVCYCEVEEIITEEDGVGMSAGDLFFPQLINLRLIELPKLRSFYHNSHNSAWPLFKQLRVRHCYKMRSFSLACEFQSCQGTTTSDNQPALFSFEKVIPHLELLELTREDVAMLPQHYIFGNLRRLAFGCYHDENVAFPSDFLLQGFPNLEGLAVGCSSFEEIFPEDALGHGGATPCGGLTDVEKPLKSLGNLKQLQLVLLRNLKVVWKDGTLMAEILKQIEYLRLCWCPSLSIVFPSPTSLQRLTTLEVEECDGLVHMGTCSTMTSLVHLTWLTLRDCGAMEDVVTDDGDGAEEIPFPKLKQLILDSLPSLESFSPTNCAFRFPSLECIVITQCPKMNIFCKGALRTPNLDKVLISYVGDEWRWEGDLNNTVRILSTCNNPHRIQ